MTFNRRSMCKCSGVLCYPLLRHLDILCAEEGDGAFPFSRPSFCRVVTLKILSFWGWSRIIAVAYGCRRLKQVVINTPDDILSCLITVRINAGGAEIRLFKTRVLSGDLPLFWVAIADGILVTPGTRDSFLSYFYVYVVHPLFTNLRYTRIVGLIPFRFGHIVII